MILRSTLPALLLCVLTCASAENKTQPAAASLDEISRALSQARTVFTHFVQERHLSLLNEPLRSEGYLCFEQPARIRWEVTAPYKSILLSDGSGVAQFEWVNESWKKLDLGLAAAMQSVVNQIASVMRGDYARGGREHDIQVKSAETGPVLTLVPNHPKMKKMIAAIEVHLAPDLKATRKVVLREQNGDFTDIRFGSQVVNPPFQERTFDRKAPLDIDQIRKAVLPREG